MNKITVSAPGKVHLMGEHAVVYGRPALLAAINLRLYVTVEVLENKPKGSILVKSDVDDRYIRHAVEVTQSHYKLDLLPAMEIAVTSQFPAGYHLGSSAAVAVATVGAVTYAVKKIWNPLAINQIAYEVEKKQHGNPSGGDNTTVTFGGFVWYRKELEFLKSIWQLQMPKQTLQKFYLVDTGKPEETTGEMIALVGKRWVVAKSKMETLFNENERCTKAVAVALRKSDEPLLISSLQQGEKTLEDIGVVSRQVKPLIRKIEKSGGAAKILGGGGVRRGTGFILCYHNSLNALKRICLNHQYKWQKVSLGEEGVRLESGR